MRTLLFISLLALSVSAQPFTQGDLAWPKQGGVASTNAVQFPLIPYKGSNYEYLIIVDFASLAPYYDPAAGAGFTNFYETNFVPTVFTNGGAAFGFSNGAICAMNVPEFVQTDWETTYLLLRRWFSVPPGATALNLFFAVDNNAQIYINGHVLNDTNVTSIVSGGDGGYAGGNWFFYNNCPSYDELQLWGITNAFWQVGSNLLSVIVENTGSVGFFDNKITGQ
jgi:hypothetical protein